LLKVDASQLGVGTWRPDEPCVMLRFVANSWKMKKIAIVMTTKVCRLVRSATRPNGTATTAPASPPRGTRANNDELAERFRRWATMARVYAPVPKNAAWPRAM
jgi:hypothetical protein